MSTAAIVLAAGGSTRMGRPKAFILLDGRTFIERIAGTARTAGVDRIFAVIGPPHGSEIERRVPEGIDVVWNGEPSRGMITSVQAGLAALPPSIDRALVWPVDMPLVSTATVRAILEVPGERVVAPRFKGRGGHPIRIPRALFGAVAALPLDEGLRGLFRRYPGWIMRIDLDDGGAIIDVDTEAELAAIRARGIP